ncbi:DUF397 domain-containing protein [Streptomyces sp. NPDC002785]|uniref:DUF397 domain-containing protein n=1 Tax=Streptomyces sp. NPDC002785 TaxID=3154543 RepID=UPI0033195B8B
MPEREWQRSSYCAGGGNNCVEIAAGNANRIVLRESESPTVVISTNRAALRALVRGVKDDKSALI